MWGEGNCANTAMCSCQDRNIVLDGEYVCKGKHCMLVMYMVYAQSAPPPPPVDRISPLPPPPWGSMPPMRRPSVEWLLHQLYLRGLFMSTFVWLALVPRVSRLCQLIFV